MKIALSCTVGGHLAELLMLRDAYRDHDVFIITNKTDRTFEYRHYNIDGTPLRSIRVFGWTFRILSILLKEKPDVVISSGAEMGIPAIFWGRLLGKKTVFIETVTRFDKPTVSGRICYWFSHEFLVQHPEMLAQYGHRARYEGAVI